MVRERSLCFAFAFAFAFACAVFVVAIAVPAVAQDGQAELRHESHDAEARSALLNAEMGDLLARSEEWTFFADAKQSTVEFEDFDYPPTAGDLLANPTGDFSLTLHGIAPTKPHILDVASVEEANEFSLILHGRLIDTIRGGPTYGISMLEGVAGTLVMSDAEGSWQIDLRQENFSIMSATFGLGLTEDWARGYFPVIMRHAKSGTEVHAQIFVLFRSEAGQKREIQVAIRKTRDDRARLGHTANLRDLLAAEPAASGSARSAVVPGFERTAIELESVAGKPLGKLGNTEAIESILCAENREITKCDDDQREVRAVELQLSGLPVGETKQNAAWNVDLLLYPAASVKRSDGTIATYFETYSGVLRIGSDVFDAHQMYVAETLGRSVYDVLAQSIRLTLPLGFGNEADPMTRTVVSATCSMAGESFVCGRVEISEALGSSGHPVGERPLDKLGSRVTISETRALQAIRAIGAKKDTGCRTLCPHCIGETSDCDGDGSAICAPVSTTRCVGNPASTTCCQSNFRSSCMNCTDDDLPGCNFYAEATKIVSLEAPFDKALQEDASCESVVLSRFQTFDSGLRVVKDDWTLFEVGKASSLKALGTSRARHVSARQECLSDRPSGTYLVIDHIPHVMNDRYIPTPEVRMESSKLAGFGDGRLVVLFEYDDRGEFLQSELIHSTVDVDREDLAKLHSALEIGYHSAGRHALSIYAFLDFSAGDKVLVQDFLVAKPKCCPLCPPNIPNCHEP